jgi:hypothetical protein
MNYKKWEKYIDFRNVESRVKLGYNKLGYNKLPGITKQIFSGFSVPNPCLDHK